VPLYYSYRLTPLHETLETLLYTKQAPVYVVHFTQAAAVERASALMSVNVSTRAEKDAIAAEIGSFRFTTGFGKNLSRFVRHGIGVHHAGMLPKYRRLVERLAQAGLLKVVCGTDTLGVGVNVPIRTVLFTALSKYDGQRTRLLSAREFHQIAGRAGRAGFDTAGSSWCRPPSTWWRTRRRWPRPATTRRSGARWSARSRRRGRSAGRADVHPARRGRAGAAHVAVPGVALDAAQRRRPPRRRVRGDAAPAGGQRLRPAHPAPADPGVDRDLPFPAGRRVVERLSTPDSEGRTVRLTVDLQDNFALNQPLSTFALAALDLLDRESETYALDAVSVIESTLDQPRQVLSAQEHKARGEAVGAMKARASSTTSGWSCCRRSATRSRWRTCCRPHTARTGAGTPGWPTTS